MPDWYMESGDLAAVDRRSGSAWSDSQGGWCELGSTSDTTPVWWRGRRSGSNRKSAEERRRDERRGKELKPSLEERARLHKELEQKEKALDEVSGPWEWLGGIAISGFMTYSFLTAVPGGIEWCANDPDKLAVLIGAAVGLPVQFLMGPFVLFVSCKMLWDSSKERNSLRDKITEITQEIDKLNAKIDALETL